MAVPTLVSRPLRRAATGLLLVLAGLVPASAVSAFHDGGTANCETCHVMHDASPGEVLMDGSSPLLTAATASDVCLSCHGGSQGVLADNPAQPGPLRGAGDFVFLFEENLNDAPNGLSSPIAGHAAGHSVISAAYGLGPDPRWSYAPGGNFPTSQLGCTSCHDPHGNTNFRMLNGTGEIQGGASSFTYDAPVAEGLEITDPNAVEGRGRHSAYRSGMSAWCANCHGFYHDEGGGHQGFHHDVDETLERGHVNQYNRYEGTVSPASGSWATAYLPEVPLEDPTASTTMTTGANAASQIMCLSCHRAHASSAPAAMRWDMGVVNLNDDGVISGSYPLPNPYPGGTQERLCAKCHRSGVPGPELMAD